MSNTTCPFCCPADDRIVRAFDAVLVLRDGFRISPGHTLIARAMQEAAEHPWLRRAVAVLQGYAAQRETDSLAKEAMYSAPRLRSRLADVNECPASYAPDEESAKASFLRRKVEQGKQFGDRPKPSDPGQA